MPGTAVIIVAAGRGRRFGAPKPKQYQVIVGAPLIRHAVLAFVRHPAISMILPVIHPDDADDLAGALDGLDYLPPVAGGATRQESVANGLEALAPHRPDRVLVHDAARPAVGQDLIDRVLGALDAAVGAIPALAVVDTLKRADDAGAITETVPRDGLWRAQTPQGFRFDDLLAAHAAAAGREMTDDAQVMEAAGHRVAVVDGDETNLKVTTTGDMARMRAILGERDGAETAPARENSKMYRIGSGFDVHRFGPGDGITLCGVDIPHDKSLVGHSDADVGLHALTDAILGAIADGDIGSHFPPSDPQWKGASSDRFLAHACSLMRDAGFGIGNADLTIICERPKIGPHRDAMRERIAEIVGVEVSRISVKATTTERLGFTGRGEGLAVQASVMLHALG